MILHGFRPLFLWDVKVLESGVQCIWHHLRFCFLLLPVHIWSIKLFQLISRTPLFHIGLMLWPSGPISITFFLHMVLLNNSKELGIHSRCQWQLTPFSKLLLMKSHMHGFWQNHQGSLVHGCMPSSITSWPKAGQQHSPRCRWSSPRSSICHPHTCCHCWVKGQPPCHSWS